jgi:hypothetical protein
MLVESTNEKLCGVPKPGSKFSLRVSSAKVLFSQEELLCVSRIHATNGITSLLFLWT